MTSLLHEACLAIRVPLDQLVAGNLYLLKARASCVGIYEPEQPNAVIRHGFTVARKKYDAEFLDTEYDWTSSAFGTVIPLRDLGPAPEYTMAEFRLAWLKEKHAEHREEASRIIREAIAALEKEHGLTPPGPEDAPSE